MAVAGTGSATATCYNNMRYEFISPVRVSHGKSKGRRTVLLLGIICFLLAFIIELSIGNWSAFIFVVPTLYLCYLRRQIEGKSVLKDAKTEIILSQSGVDIIFFDVETTRNGSLSRRYAILRRCIHSCEGDSARHIIKLVFDGQISKMDKAGKCTDPWIIRGEQLVLHIPQELFDSILAALSAN